MRSGYSLIQELSLASDYSVLVDVENLVSKVCEKLQLKEDTYGNILIAVTEAVNNAIEHGNKKQKDLTVDIKVYDSQSNFSFQIIDKGSGFNYNELPDPTAPENILKEDGRGIFLMKNLADEVSFEYPGNIVEIQFSKWLILRILVK